MSRRHETLGDTISFYKIGYQLVFAGGLEFARDLAASGKQVFLDMKLFDIGSTVEAAVRGLCRFDLDFLTVHGDPHVVRAAVRGRGSSNMKILGVSILTSLYRGDLDEMMIRDGEVQSLTVERARRSLADAGPPPLVPVRPVLTGRAVMAP